MPAEPLTAPEREEIRVGICRADTNAEIARRLGRHRATIGREIARNGGRDSYSATAAQGRAEAQRARPKEAKLAADAAFELQIDHVVALSEAWYSGAHTWSDDKLDEFADWEVNLVAVTGAVNQAKDNEDAGRWTPPRAASACAFAEITVTTKAAWELAVDPAEKAGLARMLTNCTANSEVPTTTAPPTTAPPATAPPTTRPGCATEGTYIAANGACVADWAQGGDVDCGQLPAAMKPVRVPNPANDPYRLDGSDNDGWGCEGG